MFSPGMCELFLEEKQKQWIENGWMDDFYVDL